MADEQVTTTPGTVRPAWYWIKDTAGQGSVTVTLVFVSFWVTTLAYAASIFEKIGPVSFRNFDVAACGSYMLPILGLYFGRRMTEAAYGTNAAKSPSPTNSIPPGTVK